jgi:NAD+ dependent glucose-6-phosphate dehydrogenase
MSKLKIIITGSEGIIGNVLCSKLSNQYHIIKTDNINSNDRDFYRADVSDFESIKSVFEKAGQTGAVIHLAASSLVDSGWEEILQNNIIGTRNVYDCASQYGVKRVILASSNHVTGG